MTNKFNADVLYLLWFWKSQNDMTAHYGVVARGTARSSGRMKEHECLLRNDAYGGLGKPKGGENGGHE